MRLLVVGATGGLGRAVVDTGLGRGHQVTALVRDPDAADLPAGVQCVRGDVLDPDSLEQAVRGRDAVICALGTPSPRRPMTLLENGTANLVRVMARLDVPRLVCVTLLGVGQSRANAAWLYRHVILRVLGPMVPDKEKQERVVRDSGLDWTLGSPATVRRRPAAAAGTSDPRGRKGASRTRRPQRTRGPARPCRGNRRLCSAGDRRRKVTWR